MASFLVSAYLRITELSRIFGQAVSGPGKVWFEQGHLQFCWLELKIFAPEVSTTLGEFLVNRARSGRTFWQVVPGPETRWFE